MADAKHQPTDLVGTGRSLTSLAVSASLVVVFLLMAGCGSTTASPATDNTDQPAAIVDGQRAGNLHGTLVDDPPLPKPLGTFITTTGAPFRFTDSSPRQVTALYFGFTNCDDVCPTTMADLATARRLLPADLRSAVRVAFLTVDPERDTPPVLSRWLQRFDSSFIGLRGRPFDVHAAERALYADTSTVAKTPSDRSAPRAENGGSAYQVNHTGSVYVFGPDDSSVIYTGGTLPREYAADFRRLLRGTGG